VGETRRDLPIRRAGQALNVNADSALGRRLTCRAAFLCSVLIDRCADCEVQLSADALASTRVRTGPFFH
jgi:hypothetical protein